MVKQLLVVTTLFCALSAALLAADLTGKWTAEVPGRNGQVRTQVFNLKADGDKLTGTVSGGQNDMEISDGKISGDSISFNVVREINGNTMKLAYSGTVSGDEIKMKREGGQGQPQEFTAKRAK